jgi:S-DNA-T family DNA segregation ATPase FtsK/SpoIIIE
MSFTLGDRQRLDLWGIALLALALLFALALVPVGLFGAAGTRVFGAGNIVGGAGAWLSAALRAGLGVGAYGIPLLLALWGAFTYGKVGHDAALRWSALLAGLMALLPAAFGVPAATPGAVPSTAAGWLGVAFGGGLAAALGWVGASLVLFFLFAALCVATVGWNPLRTMVRGGRASVSAAQGIVAKIPARPLRGRAETGVVGPTADEEDDWERPRDDEEPRAIWRSSRGAPGEAWEADDVFGPARARPREDDTVPFPASPPARGRRGAAREMAEPAPSPASPSDAGRSSSPASPASRETAGEVDEDATVIWPDPARPASPAVPSGSTPASAEAAAPDAGWADDALDALDALGEGTSAETAAPPVPPASPASPTASGGGETGRKASPLLASEDHLEDTGDPESTDLPAAAFLAAPPPRDEARNRLELDKLGQVLVDKLATFKIEGEIVGMTSGPVVTQFEVEPAPGIKVARIASLDADLALAMRAPSIRIVAPIPGKGAVGVEVPNPAPEMVFFREVIESPTFRASKAALPLALGKDIAGKPYVADLARMPHLLIAGATGSGKSVCVNTIITSLIYRHTPATLRFLMVDPKMVELSVYNDLPHLRHPVVTDNNDAAVVLKWAVLEMERRYALLSVNGVRNLGDFNKRVESGQVIRSNEAVGEDGDPDRWIYKGGPLPYIVVIIDELADLMMTVQGEVEKPLALLAQKARAIGIHLILATQRPSVNVITGLIKANFPSRIAFRVSSKVDSRTILDQNGADNLLGNGDMLLLPPASSEPVRIQGAYLSTEETERLMDWYRDRARIRREEALAEGRDPDADGRESDILDEVRAQEVTADDGGDDEAAGERDRLFRDAAELCIQHQGGSTSLLQRRLRIGYGRAARIIDQLHFAGVLGPPDGSKPREVLVDAIGLDRIVGDE